MANLAKLLTIAREAIQRTPRQLKAAQDRAIPGATTMDYPGIYKDPQQIVAEANVAPESPAMKQLFGVTRADLADVALNRKGNVEFRPTGAPKKPKGAAASKAIMTPGNEKRLSEILVEARNRTDLSEGMLGWYVNDPAYKRMVELVGEDEARIMFNNLNNFTGMSSPNSTVHHELVRGSAANMLNNQGRFDEFRRFGGIAAKDRGADFPIDMMKVPGHLAHKTAHALPMQKYIDGGFVDMDSPKVPAYISASGVPDVGFQTNFMVPDAHWSRLVGLPDVRTQNPTKRGASASMSEAMDLQPWWQELSRKQGLEAVPAQALVWGAGSAQTGVKSAIGAPKLEILSDLIMKTAKRLNTTPENARDLVLTGKAHAGKVDPMMLPAVAGAGAGAAYGAREYLDQ